MQQHSFVRKHAAIACTLSLALATSPFATAFAAGNDSATPIAGLAEINAQVEATTTAYREAEAELENLNAQIADNEAKVADIEARLPEQRARTAASIRTLYKFQQSSPNLIDLIISTDDFNDFVSTLHYIDSITSRNTAEIKALSTMQDELVQAQSSLVVERDAAVTKQEDAREALELARNTRAALQQRADKKAAQEADARTAAIAAAQVKVSTASSTGPVTTATTPAAPSGATTQQTTPTNSDDAKPADSKPADAKPAQNKPAEQQTPTEAPKPEANPSNQTTPQPSTPANNDKPTSEATFTTVSGNTATVEVAPAPSPSTDPIVTNTTSDEVSNWASRIDAYLEGTALAGHGSDFAQAASTYGVDPRIAPAIAGVESGWGQVCFRDHNAWGWGSSDWDSWETAIDSYVHGYSNIYGSTVTLEGAEMYASNDIYDVWYSTVLSEMDRI